MIRLGVSGRVFLLVQAYPGCPGQKPLNGRVCMCVSAATWLYFVSMAMGSITYLESKKQTS